MQATSGDWKAFEEWVADLKARFGRKGLVFRGQGDASWPLESTLERAGYKTMPFDHYYRLIVGRVAPVIATVTGMTVPEHDPILDKSFRELGDIFDATRFPSGNNYSYMAYLRHHGFPSPLLDWSRSSYVASFFAFHGPNPNAEMRSIYAYCERPEGVKGGTVGEATIRVLGPYVKAHPRHVRQQSTYTVCESYSKSHGWLYDSHQQVFERTRPRQDLLWRFNISSKERPNVLKRLNEFNLNAFSLFDSQESLLDTLWLNEQVLHE